MRGVDRVRWARGSGEVLQSDLQRDECVVRKPERWRIVAISGRIDYWGVHARRFSGRESRAGHRSEKGHAFGTCRGMWS